MELLLANLLSINIVSKSYSYCYKYTLDNLVKPVWPHLFKLKFGCFQFHPQMRLIKHLLMQSVFTNTCFFF